MIVLFLLAKVSIILSFLYRYTRKWAHMSMIFIVFFIFI